MPIIVQCPGCSSRLNVPDSAAGKRVKCPKCAQTLLVPADDFEVVDDDFEVVDDEDDFEVVDVTTPTRPNRKLSGATRKPVKRRVVEDDEDDDDDDYEEERPRRKGKKKPPPKSKLPLVIAAGAILMLLLVVGGFLMFGGGGVKWTKFETPDGALAVQFPGGAPTEGDFADMMRTGDETFEEMEKSKAAITAMQQFGISASAWQYTGPKRRYVLGVMTVPEAAAAVMKPDVVMNGFEKSFTADKGKIKVFFEQSVTVAGQSGKQFGVGKPDAAKATQVVTVFVHAGRVVFLVVDRDEFSEDDAIVKAFLDKVEAKAVTAAPAGRGR